MAVEKTSRRSCTHGSTPGFFMVRGGISLYRSLSLSLGKEEMIVLKGMRRDEEDCCEEDAV
jgi:hypothetical protein